MIRRKKFHLQVGVSQMEGFNVGKYPLHHFIPGPGCGGSRVNRLPIFIRTIGKDEWVEGCFRHRRCSDAFALEYVIEGQFIYGHRGEIFRVGQGEAFLVHPDGGECTMEAGSSYAVKRTVIILGTALHTIVDSLNLRHADVIRFPDRDAFEKLLDRVESFCPNGDPLRASAFTYELLLYLSETIGRRDQSFQISAALDYLRSNLNKQFSLNKLCRFMACSPATVYRLFQKELQVTPMECHANLRAERAAEILTGGNMSVKETAALLGFSSAQYFATEFKKRRGIPPSQLL